MNIYYIEMFGSYENSIYFPFFNFEQAKEYLLKKIIKDNKYKEIACDYDELYNIEIEEKENSWHTERQYSINIWKDGDKIINFGYAE